MGPVIAPTGLGWAPFFESAFSDLAEPGWRPGRVNSAVREVWRVPRTLTSVSAAVMLGLAAPDSGRVEAAEAKIERLDVDAQATPWVFDAGGPDYLMARGPFAAEGHPFTLPRSGRT